MGGAHPLSGEEQVQEVSDRAVGNHVILDGMLNPRHTFSLSRVHLSSSHVWLLSWDFSEKKEGVQMVHEIIHEFNER